MGEMRPKNNRLHFLWPLIFFFFLSSLLTYPVVFQPSGVFYGYPGDATGAIWQLWRLGQAVENVLPLDRWDRIGAPFGVSFQPEFYIPPVMRNIVGTALTLLCGEVFAYNFFILAGFLLAGICMYFLVYFITRNRMIGIIAGTLYSFSPYHFWQSYNHVTLAMTFWLPLFLLLLLKVDSDRRCGTAVLAGVVLGLTGLADYYYGYFLGLTLILFVCFKAVLRMRGKSAGFHPFKAGRYALLALVSLAVLLPFNYAIVKASIHPPESSRINRITTTYERPFTELLVLSSRPWNYVLPSVDHPLLGGFSREAYRVFNRIPVRNAGPLESTIYLGFVPMILGTGAVWLRKKKGRSKKRTFTGKEQFCLAFFLLLFIGSIVLALPPVLPVGKAVAKAGPAGWQENEILRSLTLPMPSKALYRIFPMFRTYVRLGLLSLLSLLILASLMMMHLQRRWKGGRALVILAGVIGFLEFINIPPFHYTQADSVPPLYRWLKDVPGRCLVAEYPAEYPHAVFFSRMHGKCILNDNRMMPYHDVLWDQISDPTDRRAQDILGALGTEYLINHTREYFPDNPTVEDPSGRVSPSLMPDHGEGLTPLAFYPDGEVYRIAPTSSRLGLVRKFGTGRFFRAWRGPSEWPLGEGENICYLLNASEAALPVTLSFKISGLVEIPLDIYVRAVGTSVLMGRLVHGSGAGPVEIGRLLLHPGLTILVIDAGRNRGITLRDGRIEVMNEVKYSNG